MSKHKHFHNIKNPAQMLQHARREKISHLDPGRARPKKRLPTMPIMPQTAKKRRRQMRENPQIPILFRRWRELQCTA